MKNTVNKEVIVVGNKVEDTMTGLQGTVVEVTEESFRIMPLENQYWERTYMGLNHERFDNKRTYGFKPYNKKNFKKIK